MKKKAFSVQAEVKTQHPDGSVVEEKIPVAGDIPQAEGIIDEPSANVGVSVGLTKNLGNYESLKVTVSLYVPCKPEEEEIEATYEAVKGWVDGKISDINAEVEAELGN